MLRVPVFPSTINKSSDKNSKPKTMLKEKTQHTIVLEKKQDKEKILKALTDFGGKILHDSGERVLIIELPKGTNLKERLPKTSKFLRFGDNIKKEITQPSQKELLFIDAFELRTSKKFLEEKKLRKPGSTPEELEMFKASDYLGDDN